MLWCGEVETMLFLSSGKIMYFAFMYGMHMICPAGLLSTRDSFYTVLTICDENDIVCWRFWTEFYSVRSANDLRHHIDFDGEAVLGPFHSILSFYKIYLS
jgi:hypothetical protein